MTLFQHTLGQLLRGEKTETSRLALPLADGEHLVGREMIQYPMGNKAVMRGTPHGWRLKWQVGRDYAIQPARGVKSVGSYRIDDIWWQDVRRTTLQQAIDEGFVYRIDFLHLWGLMHDPEFKWEFDSRILDYRVSVGHKKYILDSAQMLEMIDTRPAEHYQAWRMSITVQYETIDWDAPAVKALGIDAHLELIKALNTTVL